MVNKADVRDKLLEIERVDTAAATRSYEAYFGEATRENDRVFDLERAAAVVRDRPVQEKLESLVHEHAAHVEAIKAISFEPKTTVEPGAVVQVDDRYLVIAVSAPEFECGGVRLIGLSPMAPLYKAMKGLSAGDSFLFNGRQFAVRAVH